MIDVRCALVLCLAVMACGDDITITQYGTQHVPTQQDLPDCDEEHDGTTMYVRNTSSPYFRRAGAWEMAIPQEAIWITSIG